MKKITTGQATAASPKQGCAECATCWHGMSSPGRFLGSSPWLYGETHVEAIGTMRHDGGSPMRRDTIFRMASTSKPVAIAAAMILLDECRLRLDDLVETWLPELADRRLLKRIDGPLDDTVPARRPITGIC